MTETAVQRKESKRRQPGPDELYDQVERQREQVASTIDELLERAAPAALSERTREQVRDYFVTPEGEPRRESLIRVGIAAGCVLGGAAVLWLLRRRFHR